MEHYAQPILKDKQDHAIQSKQNHTKNICPMAPLASQNAAQDKYTGNAEADQQGENADNRSDIRIELKRHGVGKPIHVLRET